MTCTRHLLMLRWPHHEWRRRVVSTERITTWSNDMWGRSVPYDHVRCQTEYVCDECGETRDSASCFCDKEEGERCAPRLACLQEHPGIR